jgi:methyl-accepting chemotaxis protein
MEEQVYGDLLVRFKQCIEQNDDMINLITELTDRYTTAETSVTKFTELLGNGEAANKLECIKVASEQGAATLCDLRQTIFEMNSNLNRLSEGIEKVKQRMDRIEEKNLVISDIVSKINMNPVAIDQILLKLMNIEDVISTKDHNK